jgi:N utilization substance protein A
MSSTEVLAAIRELTTSKQLDRSELLDLLRDGIQAALARRYGPNVKFELDFDPLKGTLRIVRLRQVVEAVEDPSAQVSLEEAQYEDPDFAVGDMLEEDVPFAQFARSSPTRSGSCCPARSSRSSGASWSSC